MAVQTKSKSEDKGPKKKINWMQVGVIGFCVLLVFMCIVSFSGLPNALGNLINGDGISETGKVVAGNPVYVNYTMNIGDSPVLMSGMGLYAGSQTNQTQYITFEGYAYPFAIYADEYNQIAAGVVGLSVGESRSVAGSGSNLAYALTKGNITAMGLDFDTLEVKDLLYLNEYYTDELGEEAIAIRPAMITEKTSEGLVIQYGTDTIDIKMVGYLTTS
ncbi:hypothetical protein [uncultured Methanocorpusculum sp.]|nr:hypothetical protein [uncultured Methanocorpusculum sp.]